METITWTKQAKDYCTEHTQKGFIRDKIEICALGIAWEQESSTVTVAHVKQAIEKWNS